ncbi:BON domain-containing protein [Paracoccus cavernae]|uniref:BON domain-containing protein n=1 Tax=Paracoccus cavernae TaxID=1571207 RepID=A0ABT8D7B5_9RHOB|nr:BON domain-containing protein [Paracoccus cavernae]
MTQPLQPKSPKKPQRSRLARGAATVLALAAAGGLSVFAATAAADLLEERLGNEARAALSEAGYDWASVEVQGLQVRLQGTAPNEVQRFRAMLVAEGAVDAGRVIDQFEVAQSTVAKAPDFEVELLRNDEGISIIGLVPAGSSAPI